jgi:hypothetical protein
VLNVIGCAGARIERIASVWFFHFPLPLCLFVTYLAGVNLFTSPASSVLHGCLPYARHGRKREPKRRALPGFTFNPYLPAVRFNELLDDG